MKNASGEALSSNSWLERVTATKRRSEERAKPCALFVVRGIHAEYTSELGCAVVSCGLGGACVACMHSRAPSSLGPVCACVSECVRAREWNASASPRACVSNSRRDAHTGWEASERARGVARSHVTTSHPHYLP